MNMVLLSTHGIYYYDLYKHGYGCKVFIAINGFQVHVLLIIYMVFGTMIYQYEFHTYDSWFPDMKML